MLQELLDKKLSHKVNARQLSTRNVYVLRACPPSSSDAYRQGQIQGEGGGGIRDSRAVANSQAGQVLA